MRLSMFKRAFTLAEVLITLGIIGVVSAMTLPTLMNKTQNKELHAQFQKVYSELNQVAMKFKVDEEIAAPEYCRRYGKTKFIERISKYFKNVKIVDDTYYDSKDEEGNALSTKYTIHTMNGTAQRISLCDMDGFRAEIGGRIFSFNDTPNAGENGPNICVDINGQKGPNKYGYDFFIFIFTTDGFVIPIGQEHKNNPTYVAGGDNNALNFWNPPEYCTASRNAQGWQAACSYWALKNEHPLFDGKDYWNDFLNEPKN